MIWLWIGSLWFFSLLLTFQYGKRAAFRASMQGVKDLNNRLDKLGL